MLLIAHTCGGGEVLGVASVVVQGQASVESLPPSPAQLAWLGTGSGHGNSGHSGLGELQNPGMGKTVSGDCPRVRPLARILQARHSLSVSPLKLSLILYP